MKWGNMREKEIQNEILRIFGTRPDLRIWRQNTGSAYGEGVVRRVFALVRQGAFSEAVRMIATSRPVKFGVVGAADLSGIVAGRRLEIEVKGPDGKQSKEQANYQAMIERFGGVYVLARSVEDVWAAVGHLLENR